MAKIYNSDTTKELVEAAKIQQSREKTPDETAEKFIPTIESNYKLLKSPNYTKSNTHSSGGALYTNIDTLSTTQDFYLCGFSMAYTTDNNATSTYYAMNFSLPNGQSLIYWLQPTALTAQNGHMELSLDRPILLKRGSAIFMSTSSNVATFSCRGNFNGYYVDSSNA